MGSKGPNLRAYLDRSISLHLNKGRKVTGTLRGYDQFMNLVLGDCIEEVASGNSSTSSAGSSNNIGFVVVRGNSIVQLELVG